ncbi:MAG: preprotein translocase subunit SecE [Candidatus Kerfeldbacteria bacterium CG_4_10_14_0_8_um_filter_42_10]|uniref:Protein translocase subunit SecE n=1 Tax=Candidatus Kerfeldbacteria bacterium CG_4_10_14_0_8_um_filter_42_10 TaxID=2014248 RepID=A0A2M7RKD6_9BACT|nr:MAG: preprotein translocase subunit SecE [Candidatus Kerfeldbacteria bacterium CG_4_10_14_0_8_um_filter_42_10]
MSIKDNRIFRYFKESKDELRKVIWPTRAEAIKHTLIVIGVSAGVAVFLGLADYLLNIGLEQLIK